MASMRTANIFAHAEARSLRGEANYHRQEADRLAGLLPAREAAEEEEAAKWEEYVSSGRLAEQGVMLPEKWLPERPQRGAFRARVEAAETEARELEAKARAAEARAARLDAEATAEDAAARAALIQAAEADPRATVDELIHGEHIEAGTWRRIDRWRRDDTLWPLLSDEQRRALDGVPFWAIEEAAAAVDGGKRDRNWRPQHIADAAHLVGVDAFVGACVDQAR